VAGDQVTYWGDENQGPPEDIHTEPIWAIESADGTRLFYAAPEWEGIMNAAAEMRVDFPGEEFVVTKAGRYDAQATLAAQEGLAV